MTRAATDEQAILWHCEQCRHSGVLILAPDADVYSAGNTAEIAHLAVSPECAAKIGRAGLRATRPNDWFRSILELRPAALAGAE